MSDIEEIKEILKQQQRQIDELEKKLTSIPTHCITLDRHCKRLHSEVDDLIEAIRLLVATKEKEINESLDKILYITDQIKDNTNITNL